MHLTAHAKETRPVAVNWQGVRIGNFVQTHGVHPLFVIGGGRVVLRPARLHNMFVPLTKHQPG
ncbi:hypothetical protein MACH17_16120 [Phaeobacter inhibens]|nr:hypothetical protein MACH17_16120 [Phaeobacter inhibens]